MRLGLKLKRKKYIYVMYKNAWIMGTLRKLFHAKQHVSMDPSARKLQEPGNKPNKIKEN